MNHLLVVVVVVCACMSALGDTPEPLTVDSQVRHAPTLEVYRGARKSYRVSFVDGGAAANLTNRVPVMVWHSNLTSSVVSTSLYSVVGLSSTGVVDFVFAPSALNYEPGNYYYTVGYSDTNNNPVVFRQGRLSIVGSPWSVGVDAVTWVSPVNIALHTWTGVFPTSAIPSAAFASTADGGATSVVFGAVAGYDVATRTYTLDTNELPSASGATEAYVNDAVTAHSNAVVAAGYLTAETDSGTNVLYRDGTRAWLGNENGGGRSSTNWLSVYVDDDNENYVGLLFDGAYPALVFETLNKDLKLRWDEGGGSNGILQSVGSFILRGLDAPIEPTDAVPFGYAGNSYASAANLTATGTANAAATAATGSQNWAAIQLRQPSNDVLTFLSAPLAWTRQTLSAASSPVTWSCGETNRNAILVATQSLTLTMQPQHIGGYVLVLSGAGTVTWASPIAMNSNAVQSTTGTNVYTFYVGQTNGPYWGGQQRW